MSVTCDRSVVFRGTPVSSTNKTDLHDITEILLKVALNSITLTQTRITSVVISYIYNIRTLSENIKFMCTSFTNRYTSEPLGNFSSLFRRECNLILYLTTMYMYCVYPAISKSPKQLSIVWTRISTCLKTDPTWLNTISTWLNKDLTMVKYVSRHG